MVRVAIIGGGISGMTSAHLLSPRHQIDLYEAGSYLGGHTHTHTLKRPDGDWNVDTGFIVYNHKTYPAFIKLLSDLGVQGRKTTMSFSVRSDAEDVEYNGTSINSLFAQRRNFVRPAFWQMIRGIMAFNKDCKTLLAEPPTQKSLGRFIEERRYSREFAEWYIKPMAAAVWSTGTQGILEMPIYFLARFFENHGFLNIEDRPQWYTVLDGSHSYAKVIYARLKDRIHLNAPIQSVAKTHDGVAVTCANGDVKTYDYTILACHSDAALKLLKDPSARETEILKAIRWSRNDILLHTDESLLPKRRLAWAAWNYHLFGTLGSGGQNAVVTYHMNMLQGQQSKESFLVSLNSKDLVNPSKIIKTLTYEHPIFDAKATAAQGRWDEVSSGSLRFAGAYWFNGFHEDGVQSAIRAVKSIDPEIQF